MLTYKDIDQEVFPVQDLYEGDENAKASEDRLLEMLRGFIRTAPNGDGKMLKWITIKNMEYKTGEFE